ncbi:unnamed protein product [Protopolystoma xenopodis]|uniref:Uncharacterized protein n=1 Tax=Protopolystoma xenopodis TaxID=117903 RepID=A0A3S5AYF2_9PLAT|nr:unnamed protein product [Protopolystoma xenopodis]
MVKIARTSHLPSLYHGPTHLTTARIRVATVAGSRVCDRPRRPRARGKWKQLAHFDVV